MSTTNLVDIVASNIRAESARRGLYQSDIANALGVQQGTLSRRWKTIDGYADSDPECGLIVAA